MYTKEVNWDEFVFRCHYMGELMSPAKGKSNLERYNESLAKYNSLYEKIVSAKDGAYKDKLISSIVDIQNEKERLEKIKDVPKLSDTAKRRLVQIYTEATTGRVKDIKSIAIEKGIKTEEDSITLYSLRTGKMYRKNKERVGNEFVSGEIDFDDEEMDMVIDTKSSEDVFTFDNSMLSINKNYEWQGQCYMWLKNRSRFRLAYCLNNSPEEIIQKILNKEKYSFIGSEEEWRNYVEFVRHNHIYDDLPIERKVRIYDFYRDEQKIEMIKASVPYFRQFLKNITNSKFEEDYDYQD